MTTGIYVSVSSKELKTHLESRTIHHQLKGEWYDSKADDIAENAPDTSVNNNPTMGLRREAEDHLAKAAYFRFLADHLINDEYHLSENDLRMLEFISPRYLQ